MLVANVLLALAAAGSVVSAPLLGFGHRSSAPKSTSRTFNLSFGTQQNQVAPPTPPGYPPTTPGYPPAYPPTNQNYGPTSYDPTYDDGSGGVYRRSFDDEQYYNDREVHGYPTDPEDYHGFARRAVGGEPQGYPQGYEMGDVQDYGEY